MKNGRAVGVEDAFGVAWREREGGREGRREGEPSGKVKRVRKGSSKGVEDGRAVEVEDAFGVAWREREGGGEGGTVSRAERLREIGRATAKE